MTTIPLRAVYETVDTIADAQSNDGCIPWFAGGHADPWDHVEAAMALDVGGHHSRAAAAYRWMAATQRRDGAWTSRVRDGRVLDPTLDANFSTYIAVGVWHHSVVTGDGLLAAEMWPCIERAVDFALDLQAPDGSVYWARDEHGRPWPRALLTSSSCIHLSLRCALALAGSLGESRPDWELGASTLASAVADPVPGAFEPKDRFAMDWYYPVLGGVLSREQARSRLGSRWEEFVVDGLGARCVSDRPWVTSAETCELVIALDAAGMRDEAVALYGWVQHLRAADGSYWTGATFPDGVPWPQERPTWSSAAVALAGDALLGITAAAGLWRGEGLPATAISEPVGDPP